MLTVSNTLKFTALAALLALAACTTKPKSTAEEAPPIAPPAQTSGGMSQSSVVAGSVQDFRVNVGDTVHFGYNEFNVGDDDKAILQRQATWLQRYPQVRITVEGHCDERGTREYNLALGARRANSVKEFLVSEGVSSARVDTISYGKERPICTESNESCWAQNRRGVSTIVSGATS
jgi:peptidoglycan-associated lipoprotein